MTLIASFLAGSLLSLLLPVSLLIALVVWYLMFLRRVPEPDAGKDAPMTPATPNPDPAGSPELSHTPLDD
jgi:hypothetical protein